MLLPSSPLRQFAKFDAGFWASNCANEHEGARMGFPLSCQFAKFDAGFLAANCANETRRSTNGREWRLPVLLRANSQNSMREFSLSGERIPVVQAHAHSPSSALLSQRGKDDDAAFLQ
jgi:hypothetical protein